MIAGMRRFPRPIIIAEVPMKHRVSAFAVAFVFAATAGCSESMPTQPLLPPDALFAKQSTTGSRMLYYDFGNIWIMNEDGSGATALALPADQAFDPAWAPDGKRILFNAYKGEPEASIYVMNADGSAVTRITRPPAGSIDIRPTKYGKGVAFVRASATVDIYRINLDGTGETFVVSGSSPAASPSGDRLAYARDGDIWEYNTVTQQSVNLTNTPNTLENNPSYSPNGKQIAFDASIPGTISGIYVMRVDGTAVTRITSSPDDRYELPKWSPDGKRLAFARTGSGSFSPDIWVMETGDSHSFWNITQSPASSDMLTAWAR
jgi:Tol biopolymer transport system component